MTAIPSQFKRYLGNTTWMMLSRIVRLLVAFVVSVVTARYLGKELYGRLNYAISFVMLFSALASLGLNDILVRDLVKREASRDSGGILGTATILRLLGALVMILLVPAVALLLGKTSDVVWMMVVVCLSYAFLGPAQNLERFFEARVQARFSSMAQAAAIGVTAVATAVLISAKAGVSWFAVIRAIEPAALLVLLLVLFPKAGGVWNWRFERSRAGPLLRDSSPLMLTGVFILVYMRIDQVMIEYYLGEGAVGAYAVAVRLSEAWYFVPSVVAASLFPVILKSRGEGVVIYRERMQMLYEVMTWMGIAVALPTTLLAPWVIGIVYGAEFAAAAPVLGLYVWAGVFVFQGIARGKWIVAEGLQRYAIVFTGGACLINVVLNAILIPTVGINGAALATVVSCACQTILIPALFSATRPSAVALCCALAPRTLLACRRAAQRHVAGDDE